MYNKAIKNRPQKRSLDLLTLAFYCDVMYQRSFENVA